MLAYGDCVVLKASVSVWHYQETPRFSLVSVLYKLQQKRMRGTVRRVDSSTGAVGVLFPGMRDFMWFKEWELEKC